MAKVIWRKPHRFCEGNRDSHLIQESPKSLHSKQDLDPFNRVCTASRVTDRLTDAGIIDRNCLHLIDLSLK